MLELFIEWRSVQEVLQFYVKSFIGWEPSPEWKREASEDKFLHDRETLNAEVCEDCGRNINLRQLELKSLSQSL